MSVIRVEDLTFCYNGIDVISDVTFAVDEGAYLGLVGPNGSGKSTLIKNILGILPAARGRIELFGEPLGVFRRWDKIGYLPQRLSALNAHFPGTVEEIVQMGLRRRNFRDLQLTLDKMAIGHLAKRLIGELSYGEQQRAMRNSRLSTPCIFTPSSE